MRRFLLHVVAAFAVTIATALLVPIALADPYDDAATTCGQRVFEQPFSAFGDPMWYFLLDNGSFDSGTADWALGGAATTFSEPEPAFVDQAPDPSALSLSEGATATSTPVCVDVTSPTIRFFARARGALVGRLRVEVLFKDPFGQQRALTIATLTGSSSWGVTPAMPVLLNAVAAVSKYGTLGVAFRFTAVSGNWDLDRIYVDPYKDR
jgi:hypothetical protein